MADILVFGLICCIKSKSGSHGYRFKGLIILELLCKATVLGGGGGVLLPDIQGGMLTLALRVSPHWRVTFFLQPKKVTKKGRHHGWRPHKKHEGSHLASTVTMLRQAAPAHPALAEFARPCLINSHTLKSHVRSDICRRKPMITIPSKWLA